MKQIVLIMILFSIFIGSSIDKEDKTKKLVKFNETLLVDKYEVTNEDWRSYLIWLQNKNGEKSQEYKDALPDTLVWKSPLAYNEPFVNYYFSHPAYGRYPVVGLTYEQVIDYCNWRTERNKENRENENLKFRLPTKTEWLEISKINLSKKYQKKVIKKKLECHKTINEKIIFGNFICDKDKHAHITAPVDSYYPNEIGVYNLVGNIAEIISEKGIAMGGHYKEKLENFTLEKEYHYDSPTDWLGFRCVAEISK